MFLIQLSVAEQEVDRAGCVGGGFSFLPYGNIGSLLIMWNSCTREGICAGFHLLALILGEHSLVHQVPISVGFGLRIFLLRGIANQVGLGLAELRLVFSQCPSAWSICAWNGRGSISTSGSPCLTACPSS